MTEETFHSILQRYSNGACSPEEKKVVESFFQKNQDKPSILANWAETEKKKVKSSMWRNIEQESFVRQPKRWPLLRIAASVLLMMASFAVYQSYFRSEPTQQLTKITDQGQKSTLVLSDGTRVRLNAASTLSYPNQFTEGERVVSLSGEAFFEVVRNTEKPFKVKTENMEVRVLGTSFNVSVYSAAESSVTLATGSVHITAQKGDVILKPGQQAILSNAANDLTVRQVDVSEQIAWKDGVLIFKSANIDEVIQKLSRWYNVKIETSEAWPSDCRISAEYTNESLLNVLESFKFIYGLEYEIKEKNHITLKGNPCSK